MKTNLVRTPCHNLASVGTSRFIYQLSSQQMIIQWGQIVLQCRPIDLSVIHSELSTLIESMCIDQNEDYLLSINRQLIYLTRSDLRLFHIMVSEATEKLPPFVVRWKEMKLSLLPYEPALVTAIATTNVQQAICLN